MHVHPRPGNCLPPGMPFLAAVRTEKPTEANEGNEETSCFVSLCSLRSLAAKVCVGEFALKNCWRVWSEKNVDRGEVMNPFPKVPTGTTDSSPRFRMCLRSGSAAASAAPIGALAERNVCSARAPNTAREARAIPHDKQKHGFNRALRDADSRHSNAKPTR